MTDEERAEFVRLSVERCEASLSAFVEEAWHVIEPGRPFVPGWHIEAMSEHLEAVYDGQIRDLLINVPPRHMKSIEVSVLFPAWVWTKKPSLRWLFASYAASLSIRDSVKCRRVIQSKWYQDRWGHVFQLQGDQNAKEKYENNKTGHRIATSVGGSGTGEGGDIIVFDDPHKVSEAESDAVREGVIEWWDGEMSSRGNDQRTVARIGVMQRVHERDLSGHLLQQGGWEHLCLPAEFEIGRRTYTSIGWTDPRETEGELLWPERFGEPELAKLKRSMGSQRAAGQLQQRPAPAEGNIFKRQWFKRYGPGEERQLPTEYDEIVISADLSFDDKGLDPSYVVMHAWLRLGADKYLLPGYIREQIGFVKQVKEFVKFGIKHPDAMRKLVEKKANGAALLSTLEGVIPGLIPVEPRGSKIARAEASSPQVEAGNVWLPSELLEPRIGDYIEEMVNFPNAAHDDQVDTTSQALLYFGSKVDADWTPSSMTKTSTWLGRNS